MHEIKRLDQQVINQIAAGEVVERPASVVKELIENAVDAGSTYIEVSIVDGGLSKIEVKDDGKGIASEDLGLVFERYATSKLSTVDDLISIHTYGFRGEALAAISSVSKTTITSKRDDSVLQMTSDNGIVSHAVPASRGQGTTITIENLFSNVPARQKFMKSAETEYRYILSVFTRFALLNGKIHFVLNNNGKQVYNFPAATTAQFPIERVAKVHAVQESDLMGVMHEEYGITVTGFVLHPRALSATSKFFTLFVNTRPVDDKAIFKAVSQGTTGFVPDFFKPSAIISVSLPSDQIDINVHPRKTEVKLLNPFRVYAAVTHAVSNTLQTQVATPDRVQHSTVSNALLSNKAPYSSWDHKQEIAYDRLRGAHSQFTFGEGYEHEVPKQLYDTDQKDSSDPSDIDRIPAYLIDQAKLESKNAEVMPILGRYIIVGFMDEVWVIDQHAAAERVRYEQFKHAFTEGKPVEMQQLLVPITLSLTESENSIVTAHQDVFTRLGFQVELADLAVKISGIPVSLQKADIELLLRDTVNEIVEHVELLDSPIIEDFTSEKNLSLVIATMACHNSVRMNERITATEARSIVTGLLSCKIPYACPHGRRVIWRMTKEEVDRQFMRT